MTMNRSNNPPDHRIGKRLSRMVGCINRLTEDLPDTDPEIEWLMQSDDHDDIDLPDIVVLPITRFRTEGEANALLERTSQSLIDCNAGPPNTCQEIDAIFEELALNAAQHSHSSVGSSATVECFTSEDEIVFIVGIADAGIGIPTSLRRNPEYESISDDEDAILRATEIDVTGTMESRGVGLYHVTEIVRAYRGELAIVSGAGFLTVKGGEAPILGSLEELGYPAYDGTIAIVSLPIPPIR